MSTNDSYIGNTSSNNMMKINPNIPESNNRKRKNPFLLSSPPPISSTSTSSLFNTPPPSSSRPKQRSTNTNTNNTSTIHHNQNPVENLLNSLPPPYQLPPTPKLSLAKQKQQQSLKRKILSTAKEQIRLLQTKTGGSCNILNKKNDTLEIRAAIVLQRVLTQFLEEGGGVGAVGEVPTLEVLAGLVGKKRQDLEMMECLVENYLRAAPKQQQRSSINISNTTHDKEPTHVHSQNKPKTTQDQTNLNNNPSTIQNLSILLGTHYDIYDTTTLSTHAKSLFYKVQQKLVSTNALQDLLTHVVFYECACLYVAYRVQEGFAYRIGKSAAAAGGKDEDDDEEGVLEEEDLYTRNGKKRRKGGKERDTTGVIGGGEEEERLHQKLTIQHLLQMANISTSSSSKRTFRDILKYVFQVEKENASSTQFSKRKRPQSNKNGDQKGNNLESTTASKKRKWQTDDNDDNDREKMAMMNKSSFTETTTNNPNKLFFDTLFKHNQNTDLLSKSQNDMIDQWKTQTLQDAMNNAYHLLQEEEKEKDNESSSSIVLLSTTIGNTVEIKEKVEVSYKEEENEEDVLLDRAAKEVLKKYGFDFSSSSSTS